MPDLHLYIAFVLAVAALMLLPGPNVALIVANSVSHGPRYGLLTVAGTSTAMVVQLAMTALGMTALLGTLGFWFDEIRWVGVAYLVYLGVRQWRAPVVDLTGVVPEPRAARRMFVRALLVSLTNPKTLFFYGAFFPQFVAPGRDLALQLGVLCATFLLVALVIDGGWALAAAHVRKVLGKGRMRNRITGSLLVGAGIGLAIAHRR